MKPWILWLLIALLVITNAFWIYQMVDHATLADDQASEIARQQQTSKLLASLVLTLPRDRGLEDTRRILEREYPSTLIKVEGSDLELDRVTIEFRNDSVRRVTTF